MSKTGLSVASMSASEKAKLNAMLDAAQASAGGKALSKEQRQRVTEEAKAQILAARERTLLEQQRKAEREEASAQGESFSWSASVRTRPRR
jgi:hypothetical protein